MHSGVLNAQQDERNQCDACDTVRLESVSAWTDGISGVVSGAVRDDARIARVVFLNLENDLHQVGADVGNLGENAASDSQRRRSEGFANGKADKARPRIVSGDKQQDKKHHEQFDADQHHANAHAGFERNLIDRIRFAAQPGERRP